MSHRSPYSVLIAGLALFSMFFGAGDLIWPLILGATAGDKNFFALTGLLVTGVSLPLLGLISMMLFQGNYRAFFGQIGKIPSIVLILFIQAISGPIGSIPRLITLSYGSLKPYLPEDFNLHIFSVLACLVILGFTIKKQRIIDLLGLLLTPILLLCIGSILFIGMLNPPAPEVVSLTEKQAFSQGLSVGYNTLDLIASFIFAPFVLSHFCTGNENTPEAYRIAFKKMVKASLLAAGLLSAMYVGLTYVSSFYASSLDANLLPEERLSAIARHLLGSYGAIIASVAVSMICLTTAIPLVSICSDYIHHDLLKERGRAMFPLLIILAISGIIANLGFSGIANMLSPILQILCPGLIVLTVLNMLHKLYEFRTSKTPVFVTFGISTVAYLA